MAGAAVKSVSLNAEVSEITGLTVDQRIALDQQDVRREIAIGDQKIRRQFAFYVILLFVGANIFVLIGLGVAYWQDCAQLSAKLIKPDERIIDSKVVMALLGATTVQLGTVIYTITRAIFATPTS
jgi:hypothetical protein